MKRMGGCAQAKLLTGFMEASESLPPRAIKQGCPGRNHRGGGGGAVGETLPETAPETLAGAGNVVGAPKRGWPDQAL